MKRVPNIDSNEIDPSVRADVTHTLAELGKTLRELWIEEKRKYAQSQGGNQTKYKPGPRLDGGCDSVGRSFKPIWPRLAKFVLDYKLDPVAFVRSQFESCKGRPPVSPQMLTSSMALQRYRHYTANNVNIVELQLARDIQIRSARDAIELNKRLYGPTSLDVYRDVILDVNVAITALFRYMLAIECNIPELAQRWYEQALKQYMYEQDAYDLVWGPLIPQDLKLRATNVRQTASLSKF
jgi:hypothetical protein